MALVCVRLSNPYESGSGASCIIRVRLPNPYNINSFAFYFSSLLPFSSQMALVCVRLSNPYESASRASCIIRVRLPNPYNINSFASLLFSSLLHNHGIYIYIPCAVDITVREVLLSRYPLVTLS